MTLPEIPDEAIREAEIMIGLDTWTRSPTCGLCRRPEACPEHAGESLLRAAWPHLYAAALHHAIARGKERHPAGPLTYEQLRTWAAEAAS